MPPARLPARAHRRQVLRAPPLAWKCELPGQVSGCRRAPAPPRPAAAAAPPPDSPGRIPARLLPQQAIVGTARWAGDLAGPTPSLEDEPPASPRSPAGPPPPPLLSPGGGGGGLVPYFEGGS